MPAIAWIVIGALVVKWSLFGYLAWLIRRDPLDRFK